jgi:poly [ADP-ribose] polymerase 2/3/4
MPKVKPPPKSSVPSLTGVIICFASYVAKARPELGGKTISDLKLELARCGGGYTSEVPDGTHLIATETQYKNQSAKVKSAKRLNIPIVTYEWLASSLKSTEPIDTEAYLFSEESQAIADLNIEEVVKTPPRSRRKRSRSEANNDSAASDVQATPSKRFRHANPTPPPPPPTLTNGRPAKIPIDEGVPEGHSYQVHVDGKGMIWDATLNQSNSGKNNNKFYRIQILYERGSYRTWTRWGRVGTTGQTKMLGDGSLKDAISHFEAKFRDKSGNDWERRNDPSRKNKYTYLEINYEDSDGDDPVPKAASNGVDYHLKEDDENKSFAESKLTPQVQSLMELIFNANYMSNTMVSSLPVSAGPNGHGGRQRDNFLAVASVPVASSLIQSLTHP